MRGKTLAQLGKILAASYIISFSATSSLPMMDIIYGGLAIALLFSPIDIAILLDKLVKEKEK